MSEPSELDELRLMASPRDEALCRRLAARLEPAWNFVVFAVLWFFVGGTLAFVPVVGYMVAVSTVMTVQQHASSTSVGVGFIAVLLLSELGVWLLFARWVRARRRRAASLFRDGQFVEASVGNLNHVQLKGGQFTTARLSFTVDGKQASAVLSLGGHVTSIGSDGKVPVLVLPGYRYCAAFAHGGRMTPARFRG
jgi:hypothetical protein